MVIQYKNLISLYILPDQRRVNLRYFDFDQNRLWGATSLYLCSFSLHFTRSTTGKSIFIFLLFTFYPINEIKLETFRYKQTYESYITFSREAKYGILISIRIVYGGLRAYIYFPSFYILPDQRRVNLYLFSFSLHFTRSTTGGNLLVHE